MKKKIKSQLEFLSPMEQNIYRGYASKVDDMKDATLVKKSVKKILGAEIPLELETGERARISIIDVVATKTIAEAIENPSTSKLKDLSTIMGENKVEVDVNADLGSLFGDIEVKDDSGS